MTAWTTREIKMLRDLAMAGVDVDAICVRMARSPSSVKLKLIREGLSPGNPRAPMTASEIGIIKSMAASGHGVQVIAETLRRAVATVRIAAQKNGVLIKGPRGGGEIAFTVSQRVLLRIRAAAATRNLTTKALVTALIEQIAEDDKFAAIIDGGENSNSRVSQRGLGPAGIEPAHE